jgi:3-oxoacyl-[acyl-carrier-protein] synthase-1
MVLPNNSDGPSLTTSLVVNAVGACTALAPTVVQTGFLMRRGSFAVREAAILPPDGNPLAACVLPTLDPYLVGPARLMTLTNLALRDLPPTFKDQVSNLRLKVYPLLDQEFSGQLPNGQRRSDIVGFELKSRVERALFASQPSEYTPRDVTAFGEVLPQIASDLSRGVADVAIVVAAHSDLSPERVTQLFDASRLYTEDNDDGLLLGEAAVVLAISTPQTTRHRRLPQLAQVRSLHIAYDKARPDNDASSYEAIGMTFALRRAMVAGVTPTGKIGWLFSDINFERYRINEYQSILARCQDLMELPQAHEFPAQRMGFLGCATIPLNVALAATAWSYGYAPASYCASLSGHDDGTRCCIVMSQ